MKRLKQWLPVLTGLVTGLLNGLLGSGGGLVTVPMLRQCGLKPQECHATSIAVIFPLSALSAFLYLQEGRLELASALPYLPGGLAGALLGALLLPRIGTKLLRRIFALLMLWSGLRLLGVIGL